MSTNNGINSSIPIAVSQGGSGNTSHTAYAVLCGGTTGTAPVQSIVSVGTSGQVLTSNGSSALPTFQPATSGTGKIVQVVNAIQNTTESISVTAGSYTNSAFTATITPTSSSNSILIMLMVTLGTSDVSTGNFRWIELIHNIGGAGDVPILVGTTAGTRVSATAGIYINSANAIQTVSISGIDSPATTSAIIYKLALNGNETSTVFLNQSGTDTNSNAFARGISSWILMEVAP